MEFLNNVGLTLKGKQMKKKYKVRVFYNAWQDVEIKAENEEELSDIIEELSTNDVNLQLDFYEELNDE